MYKKSKVFWLFLLPSLLGVLLFYIVPFAFSLYYALIDNMGSKKFVGLKNFADTLTNSLFQSASLNTLIFIGISVSLGMGISLFLSICLQKMKKGRVPATMALLLPLVVPSGTIVYFWKVLFDNNGLVQKLLIQMGFAHETVSQNQWYMGILVLVLLFVCLISLVGCDSEQGALYSQAMGNSASESASDNATNTLTILSAYVEKNTQLPGLVEEFEALHPDVDIILEAGIPSTDIGSGDAWNQFTDRVTTELMSGEGPDILVDPGTFTMRDYLESGLVYNLREWMENDPDFSFDDYYVNLLDAFVVDGQQFTLPLNFMLKPVYLNKTLCDAAGVSFSPWETVDYREILDIYDAVKDQGILSDEFTLEIMDMTGRLALFLDAETPSFFDNQTESAAFNSPAFIQYLEDTKNIPSSRSVTDTVAASGSNFIEFFDESNIGANNSLMMSDLPRLESLIYLGDIPDNCVGPLLLSSSTGKTAFLSDLAVVVPKSCRNPELAWEFLKFCIAPVESPAYFDLYRPDGSIDTARGNFPISKENFRNYAELYGKYTVVENETGKVANDFDPTTADYPFPEDFLDQMDQAILKLDYAQNNASALQRVAYGTLLVDYYSTDSLSAQECARQIQERVEIWLSE